MMFVSPVVSGGRRMFHVGRRQQRIGVVQLGKIDLFRVPVVVDKRNRRLDFVSGFRWIGNPEIVEVLLGGAGSTDRPWP